jgi:N-acetylneuraminate synthase
MAEIQIGDRKVGDGHPLYFIAEAGSNHDLKLDQAKQLVDVAAEAGADAVKFQTFKADRLYPRSAGATDYLGDARTIHEIIRSLEMPLDWIPILAEHARARGLDFISTPFDLEAVAALVPHVPALKVASYEMTYHGLVQQCARTGKPLIVSTGTARLDEVREMLLAARHAGCRDIVVLQCTAKYPAPLSALNLRAMRTMAHDLDVLVGLSDHSREPLPGPMAAVAMGACVIEKHFTLSNQLPGPDHVYALEPGELAEVVRQVRAVERALGNGIKEPQPEEMELRAFARRSVFTTSAVPAGAPLTVANTAVLRCGKLAYGLHPADHLFVLGRRVKRALPAEIAFREEDLEPLTLRDAEVVLRPMRAADAEVVVRWRARPEIHAQLFADAPPTRAQHDAWFSALHARGDRIEMVILLEDEPVGTIGLSGIDLGGGLAEYGVLIGNPALRGRHIARRASRLILDYAFQVLGLHAVRLSMFADNEPARHLYDKLGFAVIGSSSRRKKDGVEREVVAMELRAGSRPLTVDR